MLQGWFLGHSSGCQGASLTVSHQPHALSLQPCSWWWLPQNTFSISSEGIVLFPEPFWLRAGLDGSAMAAALPSSDNASAKPRGCVLWPPRHLAVRHVKPLLQPLLSNCAIFGLATRELRSSQRKAGGDPFPSPPCRTPSPIPPMATGQPLPCLEARLGSAEVSSQPAQHWLWDSSGLCQTPIKLYTFS